LTALFIPALTLAREPRRGGKNFLRLLGRAYADPAPFIRQFLSAQYAQMIARFKAAFARALPHLPRRELSWRLHFIMGALSYTLAGTDALKLIAELNPRDTANDELLLRRLAPFLLAGLTTPLPDLDDVTRALHGAPLLRLFRKALPPMSQTEREALEAGSVWWNGELFSGRPDWRKLLDVPAATLTAEEQRFLADECETLCGMVSDWETTNVYKD